MRIKRLRRVVILTVCLVVLVCGSVLGLAAYEWRRTYFHLREARAETVAQTLLRLVQQWDEDTIRTSKTPLTSEVLQRLFAEDLSAECRRLYAFHDEKDLAYISVFAPDGTVIAHSDSSRIGSRDSNKLFLKQIGWRKTLTLRTENAYLVLLSVVNSANHDIASIVIGSDLNSYAEDFKAFLIRLALSFAGGLIILAVSLALIFFYSVTDPLSSLGTVAEHISRGHVISNSRFSESGDEFSPLGLALADISRYLQDVTALAQDIAGGQLGERRFQKHSKRDHLGLALQDMLKYLQKVETSARKISEGDLTMTLPLRAETDMFGKMLHQMMQYLREMADVATSISKGDLRGRVAPRSERDTLGNAFSDMTTYLDRLASVATMTASGDLRHEFQPLTEHDVLGNALHSMGIQLRENFEKIQKEVAERRRAQEALERLNVELEQRVEDRTAELLRQQYILDSFMANVPDNIFFKDLESRFIRANKALADLLGVENPDDLVGKGDFDFYPEEQSREKYELEQNIIRTGRPMLTFEEPVAQARWALSTKMPLRDEHGDIIGIFGISRDITELKEAQKALKSSYLQVEQQVEERTAELRREVSERKQAEQALRQGEEQYRLLAEYVRDGIIIVQGGKLLFANTAFGKMVGYTREELSAVDPLTFFPEDSKAAAQARLIFSEHKNEEPVWQVTLLRKDTQLIWAEIEESPIVWDTRFALLLTIRNITEAKLREQRLEEEHLRLRQENQTFKSAMSESYRFRSIVGKSAPMQHVYELIVSAATSEVNVLLTGESGTGKELLARTIHEVSGRKKQAFVPVNCASIPDSLFEREFFGHRKGAFTGADRDKPGYFDRAHQGVLFLDEVTELSPGCQAKLLRALQEGEYFPIGANAPKTADVMIVAATNKDWRAMIEQEQLREDFFYRICVIEIQIPPLRDRKDDLTLLIEHFLQLYAEKLQQDGADKNSRDAFSLPGAVLEMLHAYHWPGNVRELQNVMQRYLATNRLDFVRSSLPKTAAIVSQQQRPVMPEAKPATNIYQGLTLPEATEKLERQMILEYLQANENHRAKTAKMLGIPRRTLQYKLKRYGFLEK